MHRAAERLEAAELRMTSYFDNHDRRLRFPWSLYHGELSRRVAGAIRSVGPTPRVLVVGCGLEPTIPGAPPGAEIWACDLDPRAIEVCRARHPELAGRLAVSPGPYALPAELAGPFDVVVAKEVIEHVEDPTRFAEVLAKAVAPGGKLVLTTPNYGRLSTLPILERTILEWIARRDGSSRRHIHPSRFDRARLAHLAVPLRLESVAVTRTGWALVGVWRRP